MTDRINLAKTLILLSNVKGVKIAELAGIKNPNYYNWIANKPKALSENSVEKLFNVLGVSNGSLAATKINRWYEPSSTAENINEALLLLKLHNRQEYEDTTVYKVRTPDNHLLSLINIKNQKNSFLILCFNASARASDYPVDAKKLGFGHDVYIATPLNREIYSKWNQVLINIEMQTFLIEAKSNLPELNLSEFKDLQLTDNQIDLIKPIHIPKEINELKATNEGLKALIRELLKELRINSPKNNLLKDEERKSIVEKFYRHEMEKLTNSIDY